MRAWFELGYHPAPNLRKGLEGGGALETAVDLGKFHLDAVEHHHVLGHPLGELADVREQEAPLDREISRQRLHGGEAVVERGLRIVEGKPATPDDGPIAHLIAAEDQTRNAPRVEHQESPRREQQMIDVDVAAHPVGNQHLMSRLVGDSIEASEELLAPSAPL